MLCIIIIAIAQNVITDVYSLSLCCAPTTLPNHAGVTRHRFEEAGSFVLSCSDDEDVATTIVVAEPAKEEAENKRLHPLLYTHVALMAAAFGVLLPVAAFLYYHGVSLGYKVLLPIVMVLATCGFVLVVVYVQLTSRKHFHYFIHGVVGVALVALVLLGMPLLLVHQKLRVFHFRLGHAVAFFGMGNVLLVSTFCHYSITFR